jgi:hypothetical protein
MIVPTMLDEDEATSVVAASPSEGGEFAPRAAPAVHPDPTVAGRRALRAARRQRRRLMGVCAALVAACLVMTVLIVGMARDRPGLAPPAGVVTASAGSLAVALPQSSSGPVDQNPHGATAPEGGHP